MTIREANQLLLDVDCNDPEAVSAVLTDRARALAEFAATSSKELLEESLAAGNAFRQRLEGALVETRRELDRMTVLSHGLQSNLDQIQPDQIMCFG